MEDYDRDWWAHQYPSHAQYDKPYYAPDGTGPYPMPYQEREPRRPPPVAVEPDAPPPEWQGPHMTEWHKRLQEAQEFADAKKRELEAEDREFERYGYAPRAQEAVLRNAAVPPPRYRAGGARVARGAGIGPYGYYKADSPEPSAATPPAPADMAQLRRRLDQMEANYARVMANKKPTSNKDMYELDRMEAQYKRDIAPPKRDLRKELAELYKHEQDYSATMEEETPSPLTAQESELLGGWAELDRRARELESRINVKPYTKGEKK